MSILIKGMEMPQNCCECHISQTHALNNEIVYQCPFTGYFNSRVVTSQRRMNDCPLIEIPPHGRLIDADALAIALDNIDELTNGVLSVIDDAPTIIEAEVQDGER